MTDITVMFPMPCGICGNSVFVEKVFDFNWECPNCNALFEVEHYWPIDKAEECLVFIKENSKLRENRYLYFINCKQKKEIFSFILKHVTEEKRPPKKIWIDKFVLKIGKDQSQN